MRIKVTGTGEKVNDDNVRGERAKRSRRGNEIQAQLHLSAGFFRQPFFPGAQTFINSSRILTVK